MAIAIKIPSVFKAVDKISSPMRAMEKSTMSFVRKTEAGFARVQRSERKLRKGITGLVGKLGMLGIGFGALATAQQVADANINLEKNLASLSAITGVTGEAFVGFEKEIDRVSKKQRIFAGDTAKAFEIVGSAKPELLGNAEALSRVTEATMILSKATGDELSISAQNLTGTLNQFNLAADQSERVINALAAGSQAGAAAVPLITESLDKFGTVANSMNVSVEESVALIETLAEKNLKGADAGTKLRNVLTNMSAINALPREAIQQLEKFGVNMNLVSDNSIPLNDRLTELSKISDDATAMVKVFGKENLVAAQVLLNNVDKVDSYTKAVTGTNVANEQAATNTNTISKRLEELSASFKNAVTSTNSQSASIGVFKDVLGFLAKNMEKIINLTVGLIGLFVTYKALMIATRVAILAMNVAMGIQAAMSGTLTKAVASNKVALIAYATVQKTTAATTGILATASKVLAISMWGIPIVWIIAGIIALVAGIVLLVKHWDKVKKKVDEFSESAVWQILSIFNPIMKIVELISFMQDRWQGIKKAFKEGGFLGGIKAIGRALMSFVLKPLEVILRAVSKVPGKVGDLAGNALINIEAKRAELDQGLVEPVNIPATQNRVAMERSESVMRQQLDINLNNKTDKEITTGGNSGIVPKLMPTF